MIDMSDYRVYIKRLNDKFSCMSNYTSDGKYRIGPGVIYPTICNTANFQYRFIEHFNNGKKYGMYIKVVTKDDIRDVGLMYDSKYIGPYFTVNGTTACLGYSNENENEDGFYIKFLDKGTEFVIFYYHIIMFFCLDR